MDLIKKTYKYMPLYLMVIDAIESKLYRKPPVKHKNRLPNNICKVYFSNKAVELVNLPSTCCNTLLISLLKDLPYNFVTPTVVYSLQQPETSSMLSFINFVSNVNVDQCLTDSSIIVCNCEDSPFKNSYLRYILMGDVRIADSENFSLKV